MKGYFIEKTFRIIDPKLKLIQVVINIRSNSIEFTFREGKTIIPLNSISKIVLIDEKYLEEIDGMLTGEKIEYEYQR